MLKYSTLLIFFISSFWVHAQTFTITPGYVSFETDLDIVSNPYELVAESMITNNTSDTLHLEWERIVDDHSPCWATSVFGVWIQAAPSTNSLTFNLNPNQSGAMNVSVFTNFGIVGIPSAGEGEVVLKVTNLEDATDTLLVTYSFLATGDYNCITGISEIEYEQLELYPNPTNDFFNLKGAEKIQSLIVYDIMGRQVQQSSVSLGQNYDVTALSCGVYFIELIDRDQQLVKTIKLVKS